MGTNRALRISVTVPLILFGFAALLGVFGTILMLIASFRVGLVWGLVSFFVPLGMLVFTCVHWSAARLGFFVQLAAVPFCIGGVILVAQQDQKEIEAIFANPVVARLKLSQASAALPDAAAPTPTPVSRLLPHIYEARTELNQRRFTELATSYTRLTARRTTLKTLDAEAIKAFNNEVATYRSGLEAAQAEKQYLEAHRPQGL